MLDRQPTEEDDELIACACAGDRTGGGRGTGRAHPGAARRTLKDVERERFVKRFVGLLVVVAASVVSCASPAPAVAPSANAAHAAHPPPGHHGQGFHHGFRDADSWAKVFDDPERDKWQKPEAVVDILGLGPSSKVADIGAGTGYFAMRIARRVPQGRVYAVDVEPDMVRYLSERAVRESLPQVTAVLATGDDAKLPEPVDVVLIVDTLHHIDNRPAYLAKLRDKLTDGGRLFVVDFTLESPMGPPKAHRLAPETVVKDAEQAGLHPAPVALALPNQYVLAFKR